MQKKKNHKYLLAHLSCNSNKEYRFLFGNFGIKSITPGLISSRHLENLRRKLSKQFKRLSNLNKSKFYIRVHLWKAFTSKPILSRMGKGAGVINNWMAFIKPGFLLLEILTTESNLVVYNIIKRAIISFPLKLVLVKKKI